jgi:hypothetical protein
MTPSGASTSAQQAQCMGSLSTSTPSKSKRIASKRGMEWEFSSVTRCFVCAMVQIQKRMSTDAELQAELARLRAENEVLKRPRGQMALKVSEKGALSVYGLGRFPVTLYREQWEKLLAMADEIRRFIQQNDHLLKKKE